MIYTQEMVEQKVRQMFRPDEHCEVFEALSLCESHNQGVERIQLACLKLSEGNAERLSKEIELSTTDFRDVLAYAEYPNQMSCESWKLTAKERRSLVEKDLQQYKAWLNVKEGSI